MKVVMIAAAVLAAAVPVHASEVLAGPYAAQVLRVIDGDTVEARIRVWLGLDVTARVRLRGIDAPELRTDRAAAEAARDYLTRLVGAGAVTLTEVGHDKYGGRVDATVVLPDGRSANQLMLGSHHARRY